MKIRISEILEESLAIKRKLLSDDLILKSVEEISQLCIDVFKRDGKILFCGNGGSAADAQHLAAELSGRFYLDREPLFAEALNINSSFLTAVANDYHFDEVYSRMLKASGRPGDVLFALSTSGNSPNMIRVAQTALNLKIKVIAFTGETGGQLKDFCDVLINIPSTNTPRVQEGHMLIGHIICELVEAALFNAGKV